MENDQRLRSDPEVKSSPHTRGYSQVNSSAVIALRVVLVRAGIPLRQSCPTSSGRRLLCMYRGYTSTRMRLIRWRHTTPRLFGDVPPSCRSRMVTKNTPCTYRDIASCCVMPPACQISSLYIQGLSRYFSTLFPSTSSQFIYIYSDTLWQTGATS